MAYESQRVNTLKENIFFFTKKAESNISRLLAFGDCLSNLIVLATQQNDILLKKSQKHFKDFIILGMEIFFLGQTLAYLLKC